MSLHSPTRLLFLCVGSLLRGRGKNGHWNGKVSASSCCVSDKLKGLWYERHRGEEDSSSCAVQHKMYWCVKEKTVPVRGILETIIFACTYGEKGLGAQWAPVLTVVYDVYIRIRGLGVWMLLCSQGAFDRDLHCQFRLDRLCLKKMSVITLSRLGFWCLKWWWGKNNIDSSSNFFKWSKEVFLFF